MHEAFKAVSYIPLGDNGKHLMRDPVKLYVFKENLYIKDQAGSGIFVFSGRGKFLHFISFPGEGPGEFKRIIDFTISASSGQIILLNERRAIQYFSLQGVFLREEKAPFYFELMEALPDGSMFFLHEHNLNGSHPRLAGKKFIHTDRDFGILYAGLDHYFVDEASFSSQNSFFYHSGQDVLLIGHKLRNEILQYDYRNKELSPWVKLDFGKGNLEFGEIAQATDSETYYRYINLGKKRVFDGNFLLCGEKLWVPFMEVDKGGIAIFDLKGNLLNCFMGAGSFKISPKDDSHLPYLLQAQAFPIGRTEDARNLIGFIDPEQLFFLTQEMEKQNIAFPPNWPRVKASDNPVMALFTFK